jgi:ATP-dependent helicase YprA (DUF1998 family)
MSVFDLHASVVRDYRRYVQSFLSIADDRIRQFVETKLLQENVFWPDALLQLNPSYQLAQSVDDLAAAGTLAPATANIFRTRSGSPIQLYQHQCDAISRAATKHSYVVTSGTGSGKSLTYFIPIFDAILRGNSQDRKVWAIVIYPMNALVNSQFESLTALGQAYQERTGQPMPVRFEKYTGQEDEATKIRIQQERPHILLTNFMMLEMMLLRPQESAFVDKTTAGLQFLVLDELHMYRGRQGADVAMLVRRLKERCGNPDLLHIGTSATMVADRSVTGIQRRTAVGDFAGKLFGTAISESNVIEETLVPVSTYGNPVTAEDLRKSIEAPLPQNAADLLGTPLASWVESTVGIESRKALAAWRRISRKRRRPPSTSLSKSSSNFFWRAAGSNKPPEARRSRLSFISSYRKGAPSTERSRTGQAGSSRWTDSTTRPLRRRASSASFTLCSSAECAGRSITGSNMTTRRT